MRADAVLVLDLHGKNVYQARIALEAALRRRGGAYRLRVIHGYGHNTRLRDMIWAEYACHPAILRLEAGENPGQTDLVLREI
ncbi:MAG: hypothetical protein EOM66_04875 [Clostridia bacterium]|nr:hypothetical protein [Clostridia bacterium]